MNNSSVYKIYIRYECKPKNEQNLQRIHNVRGSARCRMRVHAHYYKSQSREVSPARLSGLRGTSLCVRIHSEEVALLE